MLCVEVTQGKFQSELNIEVGSLERASHSPIAALLLKLVITSTEQVSVHTCCLCAVCSTSQNPPVLLEQQFANAPAAAILHSQVPAEVHPQALALHKQAEPIYPTVESDPELTKQGQIQPDRDLITLLLLRASIPEYNCAPAIGVQSGLSAVAVRRELFCASRADVIMHQERDDAQGAAYQLDQRPGQVASWPIQNCGGGVAVRVLTSRVSRIIKADSALCACVLGLLCRGLRTILFLRYSLSREVAGGDCLWLSVVLRASIPEYNCAPAIGVQSGLSAVAVRRELFCASRADVIMHQD
ncbi:hypothetical protein DNTS_000466 [Danionella cerebrum]|uniref:Uncharacterized protein n=1 Tax=Danionella cerebrum TaxID=2873325 RepID=A0A553P9C3_9TELE|nr:hypothetical protein DNTS_000466 [Danionella translucida]